MSYSRRNRKSEYIKQARTISRPYCQRTVARKQKTTHTMRENIAHLSDKGLVSRIYEKNFQFNNENKEMQ